MYKILNLKRFTKDKEGNQLKGKFGPYTRLVVQIESQEPRYSGKNISFFENDNSPSKSWKEGDEVDFTIEQNGEYLNGKFIKADDGNKAHLEEQNRLLFRIDRKLDAIMKFHEIELETPHPLGKDYPKNEGDMPF